MKKFFILIFLLIGTLQSCYAAEAKNGDKDWRKIFPKISATDKITTLAKECPNNDLSGCKDDLYQKVWLHLEADTGQQYRLNLNSVMNSTSGGTMAVVYIASPNMMLDLSRLHRLVFECHGTYIDVTNGITNNVMDAPPRSIAGRIQNIICSVGSTGEVITHTKNKDGSETICSNKGKCEKKDPDPPHYGVTYTEARKAVIKLGWKPNPSIMKAILIKTAQLRSDGAKLDTNEPYGNCLTDNSLCDKSKPELADCSSDGLCSAVWTKYGETFYYLIKGDNITGYGSAPAGFVN